MRSIWTLRSRRASNTTNKKLLRDIDQIISSGQTSPFFKNFIGGPWVREFEKQFAAYVGSKYAVSMANGTVALCAAYQAAFLHANTVNVTPYSFVATVSEIIRTGNFPNFMDVSLSNGGIDLTGQKRLGPTVIMHPLGSPVEFYTGSQDGGPVIEDACQSLGSRFSDGSMTGTRGLAGVFSFQQTKSAQTGEGGMVVTNHKNMYDKLCHIRNHGNTYGPFKLQFRELIATNFRLTEISARLGIESLKAYPKVLKHQLRLSDILNDAIAESKVFIGQHPRTGNGYIIGSRLVNCGGFHCVAQETHTPARKMRERFLRKVRRWNKGVPGKVIGTGYSQLISDLAAFQAYAPNEPLPNARLWVNHAIWFDCRQMSIEEVKGLGRIVEKFKA